MRASTLLVWALAAGSLTYWGLRLTSQPGVAIPLPVAAVTAAIDPLVLGRILGVRAQEPVPQASAASRFALQGVVAGLPRGAAALIAVDGKPARPFRVGTEIEEGFILQSVTGRQALLSATPGGAAIVTLEMPALK